MSTLSSEPNKLNNIFRKNSGELDVFEAARYFSGGNEHQRTGRMSLDVSVPPKFQPLMEKEQIKEKIKKFKQPSSPGGKIASFLNSLFNQTSSKKNKSKSKSKDVEEDSHGGRRKRRSSISHFRITTLTTTNASTEYSSSVSGSRTPPPYANTPTKSYREFRIFSDQKKVASLPGFNNGGDCVKPGLLKKTELGSCDEKSRVKNGISQNVLKNVTTVGYEEPEIRKFSDFDCGGDSDSSSDLFDLPNHDLDFYPTGLPVYETTHMDRIKIGKPVLSYSH